MYCSRSWPATVTPHVDDEGDAMRTPSAAQTIQAGGWQTDSFYEEQDTTPADFDVLDVLDIFWSAEPTPLMAPGRPGPARAAGVIAAEQLRNREGLFQRGTSSGSGSAGGSDMELSSDMERSLDMERASSEVAASSGSGGGSDSGESSESSSLPEFPELSCLTEDAVVAVRQLKGPGDSNAAVTQASEVARSHLPRPAVVGWPMPTASQSKEMQKETRALKWSATEEQKMSRERFVAEQSRERVLGTYRLPTNMPALLLSAKAPHEIIDVNKEWCRWCRYSRDEVIGKTFQVSHGPGTQQDCVARVVSAMETGMTLGHCSSYPLTLPQLYRAFGLIWADFGWRTGVGCIAALTNYTRAGLPFRNTMFMAPVGSSFGLQEPHLLVTSTIDYPADRPLAPPRLQLPSNRPSVLFAGAETDLSSARHLLSSISIISLLYSRPDRTIDLIYSVLFNVSGTPPYPIVEVNASWLAACGMTREVRSSIENDDSSTENDDSSNTK